MDLVLIILLLIVGLILIIKAGDIFVEAAVWFAGVSRIPKFIIGATIVSIATTLPEMVVSATAAAQGNVDMSIGNAIGSVIANTGLVMGLSIAFVPIAMKRKGFFEKVIFWGLSILLFGAFALGGSFQLWQVLILLAVAVFFTLESVRSGSKDRKESEEELIKFEKRKLYINIVKFVLGTAGIFFGARLLIDNATELANFLNVPQRVIAITAVALGSSLPELATAITAIRKKETALSLGNIIGANIANIALVIPVSALIYGGALPIEPMNGIIDSGVAISLLLIVALPTLIRKKFSRWQGIALISIYLLYVAYIFFT